MGESCSQERIEEVHTEAESTTGQQQTLIKKSRKGNLHNKKEKSKI